MGYLLIPLASPGPAAWRPVLVYLLAYALMNAGASAVATMIFERGGERSAIASLSGWGYRFPVLSFCLTIFMVSLAGIPPTAGFLGKYLVFLHAIEHGRLALALVGILASLVGVAYYLRVVYMLYMKPEIAPPVSVKLDFGGMLAVVAAAAATVYIGIVPAQILHWVVAALPPG